MLPRQLAVVDSNLKVVSRFSRVAAGQSTELPGTLAPHLAEKDFDRLFFETLDVLTELLRESRDIAADSRLKPLSEPGKQVARIDLLLAEVGPQDDFRRLVLVEDKLLKNNQSRREVLAQLLDYAHAVQAGLDLDELSASVSEWVDDYREDIERAERAGDYLLIICGDGIHDDLQSLVRSYVSRLNPANQSDLILIAMAIYSDGTTHILAPHIVGGTERVGRDLTMRVVVELPNGTRLTPGTIEVQDTPEEKQTGRHATDVVEPGVFLEEWLKECGQPALEAWNSFVGAINSSQIKDRLLWEHFPGGAPHLDFADRAIGRLGVLRLADSKPMVRDMMHAQIWQTNQALQVAVQKFRGVLLTLPGAVVSRAGGGRVSVPVKSLSANADAVISAISDLSSNLGSV
jgi:hypothetical protein